MLEGTKLTRRFHSRARSLLCPGWLCATMPLRKLPSWGAPAAFLLLATLHSTSAGAGPDMACIRNPAGRAGFNGGGGGVYESCTASPVTVTPGTPAAFAWTLTPRDIADQRWDMELAVSVGRGDVDL